MENFKRITESALADVVRLSVTEAQDCPLYLTKDEFEIEYNHLIVESGKPTCLALAADIKNVLSTAHSLQQLSFSCSGCKGTITVKGVVGADLFGSLNHEQRHLVEGLVETLGRFSLFKTLNERELRTVIPEMKAGDFDPGTIIVKQGDFGQFLYIIESGAVDILSGQNDGAVITTLKQGEIFGEMNLLSGTPCTATVRIKEPTRLLALDGRHFTKLVIRYPSLQMYLFRMLAHRLRETNQLLTLRDTKGMHGSLDDLCCAELLQALHTSQKSGMLELSLPRGKALIVLKNGEFTIIDYLQMQGKEALCEILKESDGSFSFSPVLPAEYAQCRPFGDFMHLLMEGFVMLDERLHENGLS